MCIHESARRSLLTVTVAKHPGLGAAGRGLETLNYSYEAPAPVVQEQSADAAVRRAASRSFRKGAGA